MIFRVIEKHSDTCGNSWYEGIMVIIEANSLKDVMDYYKPNGFVSYEITQPGVIHLDSIKTNPIFANLRPK